MARSAMSLRMPPQFQQAFQFLHERFMIRPPLYPWGYMLYYTYRGICCQVEHIKKPAHVLAGLFCVYCHVGEALHRLGEAGDGLFRVAVLDAVPDAVLDMPLQHHLAAAGAGRDLAALIWESTSSQGTSSSTMRSMACTCPMIFFSLRCRFSESIHCFISAASIRSRV